MNYDTWLMSDRDYDKFHGLLPKDEEPPDWVLEWKQEIAIEKLMEEKKRERNI
jgi:hypothetical protein